VLASAATESVAVSAMPIAPPPPAPAAAPAPKKAEEAPAPAGPFFELTQVDRAPKVLSRVEPQVPRNVQVQANDIALVRVLVSHTGHPALVRLLRPSKGGVAQDDAIIAAVKQWTFSPASKRGEAVSCYLHVAVPLKGQ
jgi:protein TonB